MISVSLLPQRHSTVSAAAALALCVFAANTSQAAPIAYWSFDGGTAPNAAGTLPTTINSPTLDGVGAPYNSGSAPVFSEILPGPTILNGLGGPVWNTNDTSLYFTNPGLPGNVDSNAGSLVSIADPGGAGSLLKPASFTIEGFIRYEDFANYNAIFTKNRADAGGSTWMLDTDNQGRLRARFDTQPLGITSGAGFNQSFGTAVLVNDGLWHHVALTYNGTNRAVDLFFDYIDVGGGTATFDLVYDDGALRFGGSGGGRGFDGYMDEVRLSDTVLTSDQFLRAVPEPSTALLGAFGALALFGRRRRG